MPNETREDLIMTEDLIDIIKPDVVGFTILCPYPGTDLYEHDKHKNTDWETMDEYTNDFWSTEHFTNIELKAHQAYFKTKYDLLLCERQEDSSQVGGFGDMRSSTLDELEQDAPGFEDPNAQLDDEPKKSNGLNVIQ